eukprot:2331585-Prymnesium_polylepis.1
MHIPHTLTPATSTLLGVHLHPPPAPSHPHPPPALSTCTLHPHPHKTLTLRPHSHPHSEPHSYPHPTTSPYTLTFHSPPFTAPNALIAFRLRLPSARSGAHPRADHSVYDVPAQRASRLRDPRARGHARR